jgi:hypothetical protein
MNSKLKKEITDWLPVPVANLRPGLRVPRSIIEAQFALAVEFLMRAVEDTTCDDAKHDVIVYQVISAILGMCLLISISLLLVQKGVLS